MDGRLLLGLIALTAVAAQQTHPLLVVNGSLGESVDFNLYDITFPQNSQLSWSTGGTIIGKINNNNAEINPIYANRCQLFLNGTLRLEKLTRNDSRLYTVTIEAGFSKETKNYQLNVFVPVSNVTVNVNNTGFIWPGRDSVSLHCSADGSNISYSWMLDGTRLPEDQHYSQNKDTGILIISPVSSKDNGYFTCTAANPINSETSKEVSLKLAANVSDVTLHTNSSGTLWADVDSVLLQCSAQGSEITFSWSLNGTEVSSKPPYSISSSSSTSNLTISPVSKSDTGPFICTATNLANSENSSEINFDINWRPDGAIQCLSSPHNDYITFTCAWENGNPHANVEMTFNGTTETKANMVSRNVSLHAGGIQGSNLTCSGEQLGKTSMCTIPFEPPHSSQHDNNKVTEAIDGQSAVLRVKLDSTSTSRNAETAVPLPATFVWYRYNPDKTEIKSGGEFIVNFTEFESNLTITNVTPAYAGKYECTASNMAGSQSFIFILNVTKNAIPPTSENGLSGGAIAGIVIGVLAGVALIGIIVYFILRKKKKHGDSLRLSNSENGTDTVVYAEVKKANGGTAETTLTTNPSDNKNEVNYAAINFQNKPPTTSPTPTPVETVYSDVKNATKS